MLHSLESNNRLALQFNDSVENIISRVCEPLFSCFGVTVFTYSHFLNDGTYLDICTHRQWHKHYLEYFANGAFVKSHIQQIYDTTTKYVLWDNQLDDFKEKENYRFIADSCYYDVYHGISLYKKNDNTIEAWHFATTKENHKIINFYINQMDLLNHFILYFKDQMGKTLDISNPNKLISLKDKTPLTDSKKKEEKKHQFEKFIHQTTIKKFSFNTPSNGLIAISKREAECLLHLSKNKSIKEIAKSMTLSPRTVESYLDNVKKKSNCNIKSELVNLFLNNYIHHF